MSRDQVFKYGALGALFFVTVVLLVPARTHYRFFQDDYVLIERVEKISTSAGAIFGTEQKENRRHPLYFALLFAERKMFGNNTAPYFFVTYLIQLLNAVLVIRLAEKLGASPSEAQTAGLLFFSSAAFYSVMIILSCAALLQGLCFFLLATLAWLCFLAGSRRAALWAVLFQTASLLTYEVAVIFPVFAVGLTFLYEKNWRKRIEIGLKAIMPMAVFSFLLTLVLTKDFWQSNAFFSKIGQPSFDFFILKLYSFGRMFVAPVFERWRGGGAVLSSCDFGLILMLPLYTIMVGISIYFWRTRLIAQNCRALPKNLVLACLLWVISTILLFLPHPALFVHATRYTLYPAVGVLILAGVFLERFFCSVRQLFPRMGQTFNALILSYILLINVGAVAFQYYRYQHYVEAHPDLDFTAKVKHLSM